jgi:hypothetical protein
MKQNRVFKKLKILTFYIGVNVIGIPEFVEHKLAIYKYESNKF